MTKEDIIGFIEFLTEELDCNSTIADLKHTVELVPLMNTSEIIQSLGALIKKSNSAYVHEYLEELTQMILYPEE